RLFELGFADGRTRDTWRRLRFVIDQAREWGEATDGTLRQYLQWVARQSAEGARVAEAVLPESDDDAVRIMTIHAAKGLEFPIAVVSGMTTAPRAAFSPAQVAFPPVAADGSGGGVGYKFGKHVTTQAFEDYVPIDEQMAYDERVRLLYVACTRAKDHLVLSLHRKARSGDPRPSARTNAELLVAGTGAERLDQLPDAVAADSQAPPAPTPAPPEAPTPYDEWRAELDAALASGSRPTTVAATALTSEGEPDVARDEPEAVEPPEPAEAGLHKRPRDLDL
ncbi:MAG: hypothetical protein KDA98_11010, partial [Acidimicrobiales bacterium]|nr:hypothetical protein [Acidimicrobiales bacterium]